MTKSGTVMTEGLINKINIGDGLTKRELECALSFYGMVANNLRLLGPEFKLAWKEVDRTFGILQSFQRARDRG